ncbi:MAG: hypothetical protein QM478_05205 [Flavobacteriaceae bacterium]
MKRISKVSFLVLFLFFALISNTYSQETDPELLELITDTKAKMKALGYKFIEQVQGETSAENILEFKQQKFVYGYSYMAISFFKKCQSCHLSVEFWNTQTKSKELLSVETIFNESSYNTSECRINDRYNTFFYTDHSDKRGKLYMYVNDESPHYLNSLLFYK